ncbi:MAG: radical SAM protein [Spirochaetaceae bacterium]|nr:radical SAM protein [Spirochaetaceae bacterium]
MEEEVQYEGIVYRPPSEAQSLIIQATIGCAHNTCVFCSMYRGKKFRVRKMEDIKADIAEGARLYGRYVSKVFLADGDALAMTTQDMVEILAFVKQQLPQVTQISSYATAQDLLEKSLDELQLIKDSGLDLLYIGAESGDNQVLHSMAKGVTAEQLAQAGIKAHQAGFRTSVTLISGLGSRQRLKEHALESAHLISQMKPEFLGFLTLMVEEQTPLFKLVQQGKFQLLEPDEVMDEMELFLQAVDSPGTVFRANHASNYVNLRGTLNQDKERLLNQIRQARSNTSYKPEYFRGL